MRRPTATLADLCLWSCLAALLPGCGCDTVPPEAVTKCEAKITIGSAATDILFVIDESGSMLEEQQNLHDNLGDFVSALARSPVKNDFRVGVTTTSVENFDPATSATYGAGPNACAGCAPYPQGALVAIERANGAVVPNKLWYSAGAWLGPRILDSGTAALVPDFEANVLLGTNGTGKEEPLRAARLALSARIADGTNAGFLRPGARLAVVILTDEDDCSDSNHRLPTSASAGQDACHDPVRKFQAGQMDSIDDFVAFLTGPIEGEARDPVLAVIAGFNMTTGAATPRCSTSFDAPTRLDALVTALGTNAFKDSICRATFHDSLMSIADLLVPQTVPLQGALPDPRMLAVSLKKASGAVVGCPVAAKGSADAASAGAVYAPPTADAPATLTFQNACVLGSSDQVDIRIVCAG
ncbi:MAG: hypothetical protein U0229_15005 [Anaeromyxobacter sp.]